MMNAITLLEQALRVAPAQAGLWFSWGFLLQERGDHRSALESFERALSLDARLDRAWYDKVISLVKLGRVARVIARLSSFEPMVARRLERETGISAEPPLPA